MIEPAAVLDRLALAHALLSAGRTKFALARDAWMLPVELDADDAVQFCLTGAVYRAIYEMEPIKGMTVVLHEILVGTYWEIGPRRFHLTAWNDVYATDEEALALLEECAARVNPK